MVCDIIIDGDVITAVGPGAAIGIGPGPGDIDGRNKLAIPGLANSHFHSPGNFMKAAVPSLPLDLYMLFEVAPTMEVPVSAEYARLRTLLGAVEMLKQGVTAVHDDAFFLPIVTEDEVDAVMGAYEDSGLRATVALDQPNVVEYTKHPLLLQHLPVAIRERMERAPRQTATELVEAYGRFITRWHGTARGRLRAAVSCSAPQRVDPAYFTELARFSREVSIPFNMHILETRDQRMLGDRKLGKSLVRYADDLGALSERTQIIHAIWIDDDDIAVMADRGVSVAHNPVCNLRLGSGVMPLRALLDAGVSIGIGTDEANVDDGVNHWTAVKAAGLVHAITDPNYSGWPTPEEVFTAATAGGYRALCLPTRAGVLEAGSLADIVLLDLNTLPFVPRHDIYRHLVYAEPRGSVSHVLVGGELVVEDGELLTVDERELIVRIGDIAGEIEDYVSSCMTGAQELLQYYDLAYRQGLSLPVTPTYGSRAFAGGRI
jgi:5-methylthioadenosine/S-adenosylhomocysteine deaminase